MDLKALGWCAFFEEAFRMYAEAGFEPARIVSRQGNLYTALSGLGELRGKVSGRMRYECAEGADMPAVGDWVAAKGNPGTGLMTMRAVLPRRTKFERADYNKGAYLGDQVVCANVDVLFVVAGLDQELSEDRLQRYLAQGSASGAKTVVVLNKADLCANLDEVKGMAKAVTRDAPVVVASAVTGAGLRELRAFLPEGITGSMVGPSGAGKSTIINALLGEERFKTCDVRKSDAKGRHTTTHRELVILPGGGMLIDNPGMRGMGVTGDQSLVASAFGDIEELIHRCRFSDCQHRTEPDCAIKAAIESGSLTERRWKDYKRLQRELWVIARKKSQRSRLGREQSVAIKRRQRFEREGF
jgi:ribosome biogenesis GTPase